MSPLVLYASPSDASAKRLVESDERIAVAVATIESGASFSALCAWSRHTRDSTDRA